MALEKGSHGLIGKREHRQAELLCKDLVSKEEAWLKGSEQKQRKRQGFDLVCPRLSQELHTKLLVIGWSPPSTHTYTHQHITQRPKYRPYYLGVSFLCLYNAVQQLPGKQALGSWKTDQNKGRWLEDLSSNISGSDSGGGAEIVLSHLMNLWVGHWPRWHCFHTMMDSPWSQFWALLTKFLFKVWSEHKYSSELDLVC